MNGLLGDTVGQIYAQKYFSPEAKAQAQDMVANLIAAFRKRIEALDWMNPATKAEAEAKLGTLYVGIGYPETWHDYSGFEMKPDDIFGNIRRGRLAEYHRQVARLGKPVDRKEGNHVDMDNWRNLTFDGGWDASGSGRPLGWLFGAMAGRIQTRGTNGSARLTRFCQVIDRYSA